VSETRWATEKLPVRPVRAALGRRNENLIEGMGWAMKHRIGIVQGLLLGWIVIGSLPQVVGQDVGQDGKWPAFLGAGADIASAEKLPTSWSLPENLLWQVNLTGHGQSSPVVWGSLVFLTTVEGSQKDTYHVVALDTASGQEQWRVALKNSQPVKNSLYVSRAAPTPVVDGERLVVFFESGDCLALDLAGKVLWQRTLGSDYGPIEAEFGLAASPCQNDSHVFVLLEHDGPSWLLALNKETGQTDWKTQRASRISWSSPALIQVGEGQHLVISSAGSVDGYDPTSGSLLWTFDDIGGNTGTTPTDLGEGRFLIGASSGRDGQNVAEARRSNALMQVRPSADGFDVQRLWIADGVSPTWASPILHRGHAYWVNRVGAVFCVDAQSGEVLYSERTKQSCWATPLGVGQRVYLFGKDGLCTVLAAGPDFQILAENQVWNDEMLVPEESMIEQEESPERRQAAANLDRPTLYGYAIADDKFIVRIGHQVFCIGQR